MKLRAFWWLIEIVVAIGLVKLYGPLLTIKGQSVRTAQLRATKAEMVIKMGDLEGQRRFLATAAGQEAAVRRAGYLRPGERRLVFVQDAGAKK